MQTSINFSLYNRKLVTFRGKSPKCILGNESFSQKDRYIKPCNCNYYYHEECFARYLTYTLSFSCPYCKVEFPIYFDRSGLRESLVADMSIWYILASTLLNIVCLLGLFAIKIDSKYKHIKIAGICVVGLWLILNVMLCVFLWKRRKNSVGLDKLEVEMFGDSKVNENVIVFTGREKRAGEDSLRTVFLNWLMEKKRLKFGELIEYNQDRIERLEENSDSQRQIIHNYLEKYRNLDVEAGLKNFRRWNSFEKRQSKELLPEKISKLKERRSTLNAVLHIRDGEERKRSLKIGGSQGELDKTNSDLVKEIEELNESAEDSSFMSSKLRESSTSALEFSDDHINKIFKLGNHRENFSESQEDLMNSVQSEEGKRHGTEHETKKIMSHRLSTVIKFKK